MRVPTWLHRAKVWIDEAATVEDGYAELANIIDQLEREQEKLLTERDEYIAQINVAHGLNISLAARLERHEALAEKAANTFHLLAEAYPTQMREPRGWLKEYAEMREQLR